MQAFALGPAAAGNLLQQKLKLICRYKEVTEVLTRELISSLTSAELGGVLPLAAMVLEMDKEAIATIDAKNVETVEPVKVKDVEKVRPASYCELFGEADTLDYGLMALGTLGALGTGASLPAFCILFGQALDRLNATGNIQDAVNTVVVLFIIVACGNIVVSFVQVVGWTIAGERQTQKIRTKYVRAMLSQEIGW